MDLNSTPSAGRVHIGFFGKRNSGKSSLVNAVTGQELSIVSDVKGTTTDPVYKAMELLPMGPVMIIDTPGIDDEGELGLMRVKKAKQVLAKTDVAVLVADINSPLSEIEFDLIKTFNENNVPFVVAYTKSDLYTGKKELKQNEIITSAKANEGIFELKEKIAHLATDSTKEKHLVADMLCEGDIVVLVTPIDSAAPKGRLILPQQQTIRDILDSDALAVVVKEDKLTSALNSLSEKPKMVITDSQAFKSVAADTPDDILLTSFSILMARYKGVLDTAVSGITAIESLSDGDKILIAEGCTHHRQCDDIGTVKLPRWIKGYTGKNIQFDFSSGTGFPEDLSQYKMIIHCGGCMLNDREVNSRMKKASLQGIPFTNYGIAIAYMNGILKRSVEVFPHLKEILDKIEK